MKYIVDETRLVGIADAIRSKTGGAEALTLEQMPTEIAGISGGSGGDGSPRVIDHVVNIAVDADTTARTYPQPHLYNGVRLPELPFEALANYPYAWIRNNTTSGYYDLVFAAYPWYYNTNVSCSGGDSVTLPWYQIPIATADTATEWTFSKNTTGNFGADSARTVLWSNHDIPNGSATATDIYFEGTEPVPAD